MKVLYWRLTMWVTMLRHRRALHRALRRAAREGWSEHGWQ